VQNKTIRRALTAAFPRTLPVFAGYCFLGMSYGIFLKTTGLPLWFPLIMTLTIFSGSAEIIAVSLMAEAFNPLSAFVIAVMTGARYLFYGISMLDKFRGTGWKKFFLIYESVDETFSILFQSEIAPDVDKGWFMLFVTWLDHLYWVFGSMMGALLGSFIGFSTKGLDFVMTAMFVVIFLNQWMTEKKHTSELIGIGVTLGCLLLLGADKFLIPTMIAIVAALMMHKGPLSEMAEKNEEYKHKRAEEMLKAGKTK